MTRDQYNGWFYYQNMTDYTIEKNHGQNILHAGALSRFPWNKGNDSKDENEDVSLHLTVYADNRAYTRPRGMRMNGDFNQNRVNISQ
jgi:galactose mutarotase-like enzyme